MAEDNLPDFRSWGGDKKFVPLTEADIQRETNLPILRYLRNIDVTREGKNKPLRVLDLGCGRGELVGQLRRLGFDAYGVDRDARFIKAGEILNRNQDYPISILSVSEISGKTQFEDGFFDVIISNQVLEHVSDLDGIACEMSRVLKINGSVLNLFPARFRFVEPHYKLPFIHWLPKTKIRKVLLSIFLRLGMASHLFPTYSLAERVQIIYKFSAEEAFYRPNSIIIKNFRKYGIELNSRREMKRHLTTYKGGIMGLIKMLSHIFPIDVLVTNFRHVMLSGTKKTQYTSYETHHEAVKL